MEKLQLWKNEKDIIHKTGSETEELFHDDKFQTIFYSLKTAETITITPEEFPVSIMFYVLDGKVLLHAKNFEEQVSSHNSVLLTDIEKTYIMEALCYTQILMITSEDVQSVDNSEHYLQMLEKAERKDKGTWGHGRRVGKIAMRIAQEYEASYDLITLGIAATLHDIGKINTPAVILLKPGKLTKEEFDVIKRHPLDSYEILKEHYAPEISEAALQHHERMDGSGYPYGLQGEEICTNARIIAIADVFDAMTSIRSYHEAAQDEVVMKYIESHPEAYDMKFVRILRKLLDEGIIDQVRSLFDEDELNII